MPVKRAILHGARIWSLADLYDQMALDLSFPDYFGRNLDALWDALSTDIEGPLEIVWEDSASSRAALGKDFLRVAELFRRLEDERDDFRIVYR